MPNDTNLLDLLLQNRGISLELKEQFINPSYTDGLYDPFLLLNMEKACSRLFEAIKNNEKIVIYSDYDCDGIPASVIMNDFFTKINYPISIYSDDKDDSTYKDSGGNSFSYGVKVYIPNRHDEGYGLHSEAIEQFIKDKVKLLITFDLGITAIDEVAQAQASGMDVIITDHHLPKQKKQKDGQIEDDLPKAYAILNPKQKDCLYPNKMICGAGIAFKFIQALINKYGEFWKINEGWEKWLLDMVGIATLADQVSLLGENRVLAYYGLKVLKKGKRAGLVELFRKAGVDITKLNEEDVTFTLAPRINAASRMDDPHKAFKLLSTRNLTEARFFSDYLSKINDNRKIMVANIMKEVKKVLSHREEKQLIIIGNPNWRIGVLGIIASKITEEYKKTAFVWGSDGNSVICGSCRSYGDVNLVDLMASLPKDSLIEYGGHKGAGGFSVSRGEIHFLEKKLLDNLPNNNLLKEEENTYKIDATILIDDINNQNYKIIELLAPYGVDNPKPVFLLKNLKIDKVKEFGKEKNHLELIFKNSKNKEIKAISFFKDRHSFKNILEEGNVIDLIANFEKNNFAGREELRLRIIDIN